MTTGLSTGREALRHVDVAIGAVGRPGGDDRRTHVIDTSDIGAFLGLDVGKGEAVAARDGIDAVDARRAVTAVLGAVADVADDALLHRILTQLPPGHAGLFGRTDPTPTRTV
ncbi:hypothetical protein [Streptomyces sp. NPDC046332]|uniref:hypothetical protein n=1 Tax=unclassified Streptomyces TaxID=2593676 RepID=UPI003403842F